MSRKSERLQHLKSVFSDYAYVEVLKNETIVLTLPQYDVSLKELSKVLLLIDKEGYSLNSSWLTHTLGYYDAVEDIRYEFQKPG